MDINLWQNILQYCSSVSQNWLTLNLCTSIHSRGLLIYIFRYYVQLASHCGVFICFYFCIKSIDKNKRSSILPCNYPILNFIFSPLTRASDQMNLMNVLIISTIILQRAFMSTFVVRCLRKINCSFLSFLPLASCREGKHMLRWKEVVRMTF